MSLSSPFIRRPVATTLLTIAVAIAGAIAFTVLPVSPLPQVDFPTINVGANLSGASAEVMAASVATPLERQFSHIAGITEMTSSSSLGSTGITLQFDLSRDINGAARDVQAAINAARTYLPANLPSNPSYRKVNPADAPIMILGLTSGNYDVTQVYDQASTVMAQKLSQINGVGQVFVFGGATPAVRVEVDPKKLESFGLTLGSVQSTLTLQNSHSPRGQLANDTTTQDIITNNQISDASEYKPLVIGYQARRRRPPRGCRRCRRFGPGPSQCRLSRRHARRLRHRVPPTGRQHHRDRRSHQGAAAVSRSRPSCGNQNHSGDGPHHHHSSFGA